MSPRLVRVVPFLVLACLLSTALVATGSPASAAGLRYAAPGGTDAQSCLTPATACSITKAINSAAAGDEVVLQSGTYSVGVALQNTLGIAVHGIAGQPRPVIVSTASPGLKLYGTGSRAADLTLVHTGAGRALDTFSGELFEHVDVHTTGPLACFLGANSTLRDSICAASGSSGVAVASAANAVGSLTLRLRNVTAVSSGNNSAGIIVSLGQTGTLTLDLRNVIASGTNTDILRQPQDTATVNVTAASSNYDTIGGAGLGSATPPGSGTNQTAAPVFSDTTSYHQTATSPTVNAGSLDAYTGTADLDGDARQVYSAADIGADEYVDHEAPETTLAKAPKKRTFSHRAKFVFAATETGASFTCQLDKKRPAPCTSPFRTKVRKAGKHAFAVWATDNAGNVDATPVVHRWKVKRRR